MNNSTGDITDIEYPGVIKIVPVWEAVIKIILFAVIIIFSLVGNTLIIIVVVRHKRMQTATNYYIVNLAIADLMVTVSCTWVSLVDDITEGWVLGAFFCKLNTFTQVLSLVASVFSLTLIAYDRFFGIVFALKAHMTERKARTSLLIIWILSFGIASPILVYRNLFVRTWKNHIEMWCDDDWPVLETYDGSTNATAHSMPLRTCYYVFVSLILYFFPIIIMTVAYSIIILKLWTSTIPGERVDKGVAAQKKTKKKVIVMLVAILTVFGVCWLPYQISILYSELRADKQWMGEWYYHLQFAACCMAYSNSAINPLIYAGFNENFKKGIVDIYQFLTCRKKHPLIDGKTNATYYSGGTTLYYQSPSGTTCNETVLMVSHLNEDI